MTRYAIVEMEDRILKFKGDCMEPASMRPSRVLKKLRAGGTAVSDQLDAAANRASTREVSQYGAK
ncbi:MAG: hypothetical protein PHT33_00610 [bacterium]|nr:hypothetical protein [bacterium]